MRFNINFKHNKARKILHMDKSQRWTLFVLLVTLHVVLFHMIRNLNSNARTQSIRRLNSSATTASYMAPYQIKMRPGLFKIVNPSEPKYPLNVPYLLGNKTLCSSVTYLTFLVIVLSSTTNFLRRQTLRQTWAKESLYTSYGTLKVLFLLGIIDNAAVQKDIETEFKVHGDILQGAFIDTYHNLTHKSTMGFKWATERCRNAKYVIKTDDDVVINMFELFQNSILRETHKKTHVLCHRQSTWVIRDKESKWFIEPEQFKGYDKFPPYCGGLFVMILNEVVPYLYESVSRSPFFWLEDVLLYGIALKNIPGLKIEAIHVDIEQYDFQASSKCLKKRRKQCPLFIFITNSVEEIVRLWKTILRIYRV